MFYSKRGPKCRQEKAGIKLARKPLVANTVYNPGDQRSDSNQDRSEGEPRQS